MSNPNHNQPDPATARFVAHLLGASEQALVFLGHAPNPVDGQRERSLPMAREVIDHLEMLETKTRGNLGKDESQILRDILTRLRLAYAEECSRPDDATQPPQATATHTPPVPPRPDTPPTTTNADPKISGDADSEQRRFHKTYE